MSDRRGRPVLVVPEADGLQVHSSRGYKTGVVPIPAENPVRLPQPKAGYAKGGRYYATKEIKLVITLPAEVVQRIDSETGWRAGLKEIRRRSGFIHRAVLAYLDELEDARRPPPAIPAPRIPLPPAAPLPPRLETPDETLDEIYYTSSGSIDRSRE